MHDQEHDPGPVPESDGELTDEEYANLHSTIDVAHFIFTQMLQDLGASGEVGSMYEPFQPLVRMVMIAAVAYYRDHGQPALAERARALIDSGRLDSPSVARAPSPAEVTATIIKRLDEASADVEDLYTAEYKAMMVSVIADAMDCACKQAIAAPQTHGSRFARQSEPG